MKNMCFSTLLSLTLLLQSVDAFSTSPLKSRTKSLSQNHHQGPLRLRHADAVSRALTASVSSISETKVREEEEDDDSVNNLGEKEPGSKLRRLKDLMWVRETLEDLTAAEFACTVEATVEEDDRRRRKRAVDYEKLMNQLNKRVRDLGCRGPPQEQGKIWEKEVTDTTAALSCVLQPGVGMGSIVYTDEQRASLLERIIRTRHLLLEVMQGHELHVEDSAGELPFLISLPELRVEIPKEHQSDEEISPGPKLYVRDDGTVDWDGALQDRAALRKFGTAVWARINGRDPDKIEEEEEEESHIKDMQRQTTTVKQVTAKIEETPAIVQARQRLNELKGQLRTQKVEHIKLLNSAIRAGQAVANVRLAALEPKLRNQIRESEEALELMEEKVAFQTLIYELERIYTYLLREIGNPALPGYIPLQDRLNVAEFGLLESQIDSFKQQLEAGDNVDNDVLAVVMEQLTDFKRRLGIDYLVTGFSFDGEGIKRWLGDLLEKTKKGFAFYVKGVQLFWNDLMFCLRLINRAAQGYTLKPREVRTLRRTFKDIITFIPFVIILLIPLSPIGHVLVFGAIQRFFPDFFPSCFTEQRQNLLQLYETAEYSEVTINENWREKLARISEAFVFSVANASKTLYVWLVGVTQGGRNKDKGEKKK